MLKTKDKRHVCNEMTKKDYLPAPKVLSTVYKWYLNNFEINLNLNGL